jgi:hypothetical protein
VISLFNGFILLVALQLQALKLGDQISLVFTTVLGEVRLGLLEEEGEQEPADLAYWEKRGSKTTLAMADQMLTMLQSLDKDLSFRYNKYYIGLGKQGRPNNFVTFCPKKDWLRFEARLERSDDIQAKLDDAGLDLMEYDSRWGSYRIRLVKADLTKHEALLMELLKAAYEQASSSL